MTGPTDHTASEPWLEPVGHLTFERVPFDFSSIPSNERLAEAAVEQAPVLRIACLLGSRSDKELEEAVRESDDANTWLDAVDTFQALSDHWNSNVEILDRAVARVLIVMERVYGEPGGGGAEGTA